MSLAQLARRLILNANAGTKGILLFVRSLANANPAKHRDSQAVLLQPLQLSIELDKFSPQASQFPLGQAQAPSPLIQEFAAANNCGRWNWWRWS